jgi:hypothetical protein
MQSTGKIWVFFNSQSGKQTKPMSTLQAQMAMLTFKAKELKDIFIWTPGWEDWQNVDAFLKSEQTFFVLSHPPKPVRETRTGIKHEGKSKSTRHPSDEKADGETETDIGAITKTDVRYTKVDVSGKVPEADKTDYGYYHQDFNGHDLDLSKIRKLPKVNVKIKVPKASDLNDDENRRIAIRHNFKLVVVLITKEKSFRTYSKNISLGGTLLEDMIPVDFLNKPFDLIIINRFESDPKNRRLLFKAKIVGDISDPRRLMFMETDPSMMARLDVLLKAYNTYQEQMRKQVG